MKKSIGRQDPVGKAVSVFIPWIVKRPGHECQVLFPLSELDTLVEKAIKAAWDATRDGAKQQQ